MKSVNLAHSLPVAFMVTMVAVALLEIPMASAAPVGGAGPCSKVEMGPAVKMSVGKATLLRLDTPAARILLGNPSGSQAVRPSEAAGTAATAVAPAVGSQQQNARRPGVAEVDVLLLGPREVYLLGKTIGATNVAMVDRNGVCTVMDLVVGMDTAGLSATLAELLPNEKQIKVSSAADSIVLSGAVSDAAAADKALDLARAYVQRVGAGTAGGRASAHDFVINMLAVNAPQQVMLEVKVAEVSKTVLDQFGINFSRAFALADGTAIRFLNGLFGGQAFSYGGVSGTVGAKVGGGAAALNSGSNYGVGVTSPVGSATLGDTTSIPLVGGTNAVSFGVDAQKQDGLVKILAEPNVMAISGQEGSFLAGGKIFIPVVSRDNGSTTYTLEEKEFGVSLRFRPTVLGDGRINLQVNPEVSELSSSGVTISSSATGGTTILPAMSTRKASTTVQLFDGQSFAIGGLMKSNSAGSINAFPFLGEIPVLGALFRSHEFKTDRSELVFVITPRIVKPLPANYSLPTDGYTDPNRWQLYGRGKLEGSAPDNAPAERQAVPAQTPPEAPAKGGFEVR